MSLSFVSKSVLTATSDGYEEKPIEGKETEGGTSSSMPAARPLFDQLRSNKEEEEQEREEFQKSIMRGTLALDEEDCAHLDALQKQKQEQAQEIQRQTQSELESFRAAQAVNRIEQGAIQEEEDEKQNEAVVKQPKKPATNNKPKFPQIVVKKKRKKGESEGAEAKKPKQNSTEESAKPADAKPAMAGLLAGYGSDSDSD